MQADPFLKQKMLKIHCQLFCLLLHGVKYLLILHEPDPFQQSFVAADQPINKLMQICKEQK